MAKRALAVRRAKLDAPSHLWEESVKGKLAHKYLDPLHMFLSLLPDLTEGNTN